MAPLKDTVNLAKASVPSLTVTEVASNCTPLPVGIIVVYGAVCGVRSKDPHADVGLYVGQCYGKGLRGLDDGIVGNRHIDIEGRGCTVEGNGARLCGEVAAVECRPVVGGIVDGDVLSRLYGPVEGHGEPCEGIGPLPYGDGGGIELHAVSVGIVIVNGAVCGVRSKDSHTDVGLYVGQCYGKGLRGLDDGIVGNGHVDIEGRGCTVEGDGARLCGEVASIGGRPVVGPIVDGDVLSRLYGPVEGHR